MFLRAGALSLVLLLASRLLGLLRESAQAAAFGATGLGDLVVVLLTLPDWVAGVVSGGALAYVMLPAWAAMKPVEVRSTQRRLASALLFLGLGLAIALAIGREQVLEALVPGLPQELHSIARQALLWSAAALPMALLAGLWGTRLQHEREYLGMYGSNVVVNGLLIAALAASAAVPGTRGAIALLGGGLLAAMAGRLAWLAWRQRPFGGGASGAGVQALPAWRVWAWAVLAVGLPLVLPFAARSVASQSGEGGLAVFNYAWKLVELPLVLAIQLVSTIAFAPISAALALSGPGGSERAREAVGPAFALAWSLACAAASGLVWAAPAVAQLLFGWGRMDPEAVARLAAWGRVGAWSLLPQSLIAVSLVVLASRRRMRAVVIAYAGALGAILGAGAYGVSDGRSLMLLLGVVLSGVALVAVAALGSDALRWIPWPALLAAALVPLLCQIALSAELVPVGESWNQLVLGAGAALATMAAAWAADGDLRRALRR